MIEKNIEEIYDEYRIMPSLRDHMYRVTAVAEHMITLWKGPDLDEKSIIEVSLLHDIGNILKFDLTLYPDFLKPEGLSYWQGVQNDYKTKYGLNQDEATLMIAKEMGVSEGTYALLHELVANHFQYTVDSDSPDLRICEYADISVSPHGIPGRKERVHDLEMRNVRNHGISIEKAKSHTKKYYTQIETIESNLNKHGAITNFDLTSVDVKDISYLKEYQLSTDC